MLFYALSLMGPHIWKIAVDGLLRDLNEEFGVVSYEDVTVIPAESNGRKDSETRGKVAVKILRD